MRSCSVKLISFNDLFRQKLGVLLDNITPRTITRADGLPSEGVIIEDIEKDSPADKAKLLPGFIITGIDEEKIGEVLKAADVLSTKTAGARAAISFVVPPQFGESAGRYTATVVLR